MLVYVHVRAADDGVDVGMLDGVELVAQVCRVVVEHHGEGGEDIGTRLFGGLAHEGGAHQVAHSLGTVGGRPAALSVAVKLCQQICRHGDGDACELAAHLLLLPRCFRQPRCRLERLDNGVCERLDETGV